MGAAKPQPVLGDSEWALVIELLERERKELPAQIHHSRTGTFTGDLRARLTMVEQLLERLSHLQAEA